MRCHGSSFAASGACDQADGNKPMTDHKQASYLTLDHQIFPNKTPDTHISEVSGILLEIL